MKLHLGCGKNHLPGWVNVDKLPTVSPDRIVDLSRFPWPFKTESVSEVLAENILEHLPDTVRVMIELHRILKPGGTVTITVPYAGSHGALMDPTHVSFFTEKTFLYFSQDFYWNWYSPAHFQIKSKLGSNSSNWKERLRNLIPFRPLLRYFFWNMYDRVDCVLTKPGLKK